MGFIAERTGWPVKACRGELDDGCLTARRCFDDHPCGECANLGLYELRFAH